MVNGENEDVYLKKSRSKEIICRISCLGEIKMILKYHKENKPMNVIYHISIINLRTKIILFRF